MEVCAGLASLVNNYKIGGSNSTLQELDNAFTLHEHFKTQKVPLAIFVFQNAAKIFQRILVNGKVLVTPKGGI